jgi:diguanylate cyclase (GGDEF)-like protein/PAS domain S-box-containing protein
MDIAATPHGAASRHYLHARKLFTLIGGLFGGLFVIGFLVALAALVNLATRLNTEQREQSYFYVQKALQARIANSESLITSYAVWNAAYQHLSGSVDRHWAYDEHNLGTSLYTQNGYDGVFVVDRQGTQYALFEGQPSNTAAREFISTPLRPLIESVQAKAASASPISHYVMFNGWPALLSASAILPDDDSPRPDAKHSPVLLLVDQLSADKLAQMSQAYNLPHLILESRETGLVGRPRLPLGDTGYDLTWEPAQPGRQLLWAVLPALGAATVLLCLLMFWLLRYALRTCEAIDDSYRGLKISNRALEASEERFRGVAESASDWVWETDRNCRLSYLSARFTAITGYTSNDWLGQDIEQLFSCETTPLAHWLHTLTGNGMASLRCAYRNQVGQPRYCRVSARPIRLNGQICGFRGTASDITDEVAAHGQVLHLSMHDALTGLPNRNRLNRYFEEARAQRPHPPALTLILLDLADVRPLHDALHPLGDAVWLEVAARLRASTRKNDLVARLGDDVFVLILSGIDSQAVIERCCSRLIDNLHRPILHHDQMLHIDTRLGIAQSRSQGLDAGELIRCAGIARQQAEADGTRTWQFFSPEMNPQVQQRRQLENDLHAALRHQELVLHFQPRYQLDSLRIVAAQALLHWQHPVDGLLAPDIFMPLAELTDLSVPLGRWLLREACDTARCWPEHIQVSVNLSPAQFRRSDLVSDIRDILVQTGFPAQRLTLEITENVIFNDIDGALRTLNALKELGLRLSLDHFGSGYSSLGCLRTYPLDGIRIDKHFIAAPGNDSDRAVLQAIISLGKAVGLSVSAEGVETEQQLQALRSDGCHVVQGGYMSRPVDKHAFEQLLKAHLADKVFVTATCDAR